MGGKPGRGDALALADAALSAVDSAVREASGVRLRAAVDRLMDSAAGDVFFVPLHPDWYHGGDRAAYAEWALSVTGTDVEPRLCRGCCWDEESGLYCSDMAAEKTDADGMWCANGTVPDTPDNRAVLADPPDGVPPQYEAQLFDLVELPDGAVDLVEALGDMCPCEDCQEVRAQ